MKIRNGFVSNSSSSSFVVLGVKYMDNGDDDRYDVWNWSQGGMRTLCDDGCYYKGFVLGESDCDFMESETYSRWELGELAKQVAEALKVDMNEVQLYLGTRSC